MLLERAAHGVKRLQAFAGDDEHDALVGADLAALRELRKARRRHAAGGLGEDARRLGQQADAAADLVVTDDRLETILAALVEGRAMWASVREALGVLVGGNLGEIGFTVLGASTTGTSPLTARQLLLVNLLFNIRS